MKKNKILGLGTLAMAGVLAFTGCSVSDEDGKAWAEENGYVKDTAKWAADNGYVKAEDYNIDVNADLTTGGSDTADNPETQLTTAEKLAIIKDYLRGAVLYYTDPQDATKKYAPKVDTTTTPHTRVEGKAVAVTYKFMYKANAACTVGENDYDAGEEIEENEYTAMSETDKAKFTKVTKTVYGEEVDTEGLNAVYSYREMYPIATSYNNNPGLATAEFWIDLDTMKLYSFSEKGTEKVLYIENNPSVELYFTKQVEEDVYVAEGSNYYPGGTDYWRSYGVQIKGTAKLLDSKGADADVFNSIVNKYAETMYGFEEWGKMQFDGSVARIPTVYSTYMNCIEITPSEYIVNSLWAKYISAKNGAPAEKWGRDSEGNVINELFDNWAEKLVDKDVRQTYVPTYNED